MVKNSFLIIHALTSLRPGAGSAPDVVDLPVQREVHTRWPYIPGSALKGVLRNCAREAIASGIAVDVSAVFGPEKDNAKENAGALAFFDARILVFPVRSFRGTFAWVTSPGVIDRLNRDLNLKLPVPAPQSGNVLCAPSTTLNFEGQVGLEESVQSADGDAQVKEIADWLDLTAGITHSNHHLAIVTDEQFTGFVRRATSLVARNALDYETKTAEDKALFYMEMLPPETLFYCKLEAFDSRKNGLKLSQEQVLESLDKVLNARKIMQIGANATTGAGFCRLTLAKEQTS